MEHVVSIEYYKTQLVGRTIVDVRDLTQEEKDEYDWYGAGYVLVLDNGTEVIPTSDSEGNNCGSMWVQSDG